MRLYQVVYSDVCDDITQITVLRAQNKREVRRRVERAAKGETKTIERADMEFLRDVIGDEGLKLVEAEGEYTYIM